MTSRIGPARQPQQPHPPLGRYEYSADTRPGSLRNCKRMIDFDRPVKTENRHDRKPSDDYVPGGE
jgi:hypothetical protein